VNIKLGRECILRRFGRTAKSDPQLRYISVRPYVRMKHLGYHWTDLHEI